MANAVNRRSIERVREEIYGIPSGKARARTQKAHQKLLKNLKRTGNALVRHAESRRKAGDYAAGVLMLELAMTLRLTADVLRGRS